MHILYVFSLFSVQRVAQIRKIPFSEASESSGDESSGRVSDDQQRKLSPDSDVSPVFPGSGSQTKAFSTAIQMRRNGSPGLARAIKRGNSSLVFLIFTATVFIVKLSSSLESQYSNQISKTSTSLRRKQIILKFFRTVRVFILL